MVAELLSEVRTASWICCTTLLGRHMRTLSLGSARSLGSEPNESGSMLAPSLCMEMTVVGGMAWMVFLSSSRATITLPMVVPDIPVMSSQRPERTTVFEPCGTPSACRPPVSSFPSRRDLSLFANWRTAETETFPLSSANPWSARNRRSRVEGDVAIFNARVPFVCVLCVRTNEQTFFPHASNSHH